MGRLICVWIWLILWTGGLGGLRDVSGIEWGILRSLAGSGKQCVHIEGDSISMANGAVLELTPCSLGSPGQQFNVSKWGEFWEGGGGPLVFRSGQCITGDPRPPPASNGGWWATAYDYSGQPHQNWIIAGSELGAASPFQLVGSNGKCLSRDVDGLHFYGWTCEGKDTAPHQWFIMERVPVTVALANIGIPNKCIHIQGDSTSDGAPLDLATCGVTISQLTIAPELSQYVTTPGPLTFLSGKCLTGSASDSTNGVGMTASDCSGVLHQNWKIVGGVPFSSPFQVVGSNGKCLSGEAGGAAIRQWDCGSLTTAPHHWFTTLQPSRVALLESVAWDGLCVHIKGDSLANGALLKMIPCDPTSIAQQFDITDWGTYKSSRGRLQFVFGRCITGDWVGTENGVPTIAWRCQDQEQPQQTFLMRSGSLFETNNFQLQAHNGLCLNPSPSDRGASFSQWTCGDFASAPHQFFRVDTRGVIPPSSAASSSSPEPPPPPPPVPHCLLPGDICSPDDVRCCDGEYCQTFFSSSTCRTCLPEGSTCGISPYAQRCCQCCSCRDNPGSGATCQRGACVGDTGAACSAEMPCCGGMECSPWLETFVCRPTQPQCYKTGYSGGVSCVECCAGRCGSSTLYVSTEGLNYADSAPAGFIGGACDCASSEDHCLDDSYCCSGKCGIDYFCID